MASKTLPKRPWLYLICDCAAVQRGVVAQAVEGGVNLVQLRDKSQSTRALLAAAAPLLALLRPHGIPLLINDRVDVALAAGADGVHLGQEDLPVLTARQLLGPEALIGWSIDTPDQFETARNLPLDYLGYGPVFSTPSKADAGDAIGLEALQRGVNASAQPVVAIGGIDAHNAAAVQACGVAGCAVISAISANPDPHAAALALRQAQGDA